MWGRWSLTCKSFLILGSEESNWPIYLECPCKSAELLIGSLPSVARLG